MNSDEELLIHLRLQESDLVHPKFVECVKNLANILQNQHNSNGSSSPSLMNKSMVQDV